MRQVNGDRLINLFTNAHYDDDILRVSIYFNEKLLFNFDPHIGKDIINVDRLKDEYIKPGVEFSNATISHGEFIVWLTSKDLLGGMDRLYVEDIVNTLQGKITLRVVMPEYGGKTSWHYIDTTNINYEVCTLYVNQSTIGIACYGNQAI